MSLTLTLTLTLTLSLGDIFTRYELSEHGNPENCVHLVTKWGSKTLQGRLTRRELYCIVAVNPHKSRAIRELGRAIMCHREAFACFERFGRGPEDADRVTPMMIHEFLRNCLAQRPMLYDIQRLVANARATSEKAAQEMSVLNLYVTFPEFVKMLNNVHRIPKLDMPRVILRARLDEFRLWFTLFDPDGDGSITMEEMQQVFHALGHYVTLEQLREMVGHVDENDNGQIDFVEFVTVMTSNSGGAAQKQLTNTVAGLHQLFRLFDADGGGEIDNQEPNPNPNPN